MSHTNSTTNYNLPQFLPTDKPFWLTDINGAFSTIDTAIDAAKDAADAAQADATQALSDASSASTAAAAADGKGSGAVASLTDTFDPTSTYTVGSLVMYNNLMYFCTVAVTTPGPWTGTANWRRNTVFDSLKEFFGHFTELTSIVRSVDHGPLTLNGTYQIPSEILAKNLILIEFRRYGLGGTVVVPLAALTGGAFNAGIEIAASEACKWTFSISETGLITLKSRIGDSDPWVDLYAWG